MQSSRRLNALPTAHHRLVEEQTHRVGRFRHPRSCPNTREFSTDFIRAGCVNLGMRMQGTAMVVVAGGGGGGVSVTWSREASD